MGNENERKRSPAENRENEMGHKWDEVKTGGDERNVGLTNDQAGGQSATGETSGRGDRETEPAIGPGGQSEIGGASDLGGGETGLGSGGGFIGSESDEASSDYLQRGGNPQAGFAEQGRGAPDGSEPGGVEGIGERTENRDTDVEGSSKTR